MMISRSLIFISASFLLASAVNVSRESAWNGHTTPGSETAAPFLPWYVPPGAKSYDSASPLIHYTGKWMDSFSPAYVQRTLRWTDKPGASASFTFTGTGIEWFGGLDTTHGTAYVYIDGVKMPDVDTWNDYPLRQQRIFWKFDLTYGKHTIKVVKADKGSKSSSIVDVDAFVVTQIPPSYVQAAQQPDLLGPGSSGLQLESHALSNAPQWTLTQKGVTGVSAMQIAIISPTHALIIDKVEHNPLTLSGHPAWAALYNLRTHSVKPMRLQSNSFCAGGSFLSNGTLINVGGNPVVDGFTSAADFGDLDGLQAIRIFEPCEFDSVSGCEIYENHARIRMASARWYNTVVRISDGSAMILGGSKKGGWINNATVNNPTLEYWPPKSIHGSNGLPIHLPFLVDTLNSNLFPIAFALPDDRIFVAANQDAMIYDWKNNVEQRLPVIPNGVRVTYPMAGTGLLLPLSPENNYAPEILLCGGSTVDDTKAGYEISSQDPASAQCSRMVLTDDGIAAGWQVEQLPEARTMPDAVLLPTGEIVFINGARTGISGYGNVVNQVGQSNADNPTLTPVLYNPVAPAGQRFSSEGMKSSLIPRLYHSVATLTPNGDIMVAGSNPNLDRSEVKYGTEYRVEWVGPPYMSSDRPMVKSAPKKLDFGEGAKFAVTLPSSLKRNPDIKVALMDLGFVTHAVHANSRLVYLVASLSDDGETLEVTGPPNANIYPPGPGWIYVVVDGAPSVGVQIMIGDGQGPTVDDAALDNVLEKTSVDQYEASKKGDKQEDGSE
ncbi:putative copper radical oxidase [Leucogyrophana mollusca]|uniref:Copper radical oxidase n=1 Tax=Leucogyrophana mollusca TaxID=85980 RepID=A0ACB8BM67_9AGAM|nr:putative copper radical oxidase [Leucogyrophana mollusca]